MSRIRFGCPQAAIYRLKETVTLTQASLIVKRGVLAFRHRAMKQPLPLTKTFEREAARQTRSLVPCCQPPCFRQGGIINIPDRLSTARRQNYLNSYTE
jgi:hypothetical protein